MKSILLICSLCLTFACAGSGPDDRTLLAKLSDSQTNAHSFPQGDPRVALIQQKVMAAFTNFDRESLSSSIPKLYSQDAYLNDRLHEVEGRDKITSYLVDSTDKVASARFIFQAPTQQGIEFYFP